MHEIKRFIPATFVVLWATGFIGARYAMPWAEPFTFLGTRFVIAAILFVLLSSILAILVSFSYDGTAPQVKP